MYECVVQCQLKLIKKIECNVKCLAHVNTSGQFHAFTLHHCICVLMCHVECGRRALIFTCFVCLMTSINWQQLRTHCSHCSHQFNGRTFFFELFVRSPNAQAITSHAEISHSPLTHMIEVTNAVFRFFFAFLIFNEAATVTHCSRLRVLFNACHRSQRLRRHRGSTSAHI